MSETAYPHSIAPKRSLKHRRETISPSGTGRSSTPLVHSSSPGYRARPFDSHHSLLRKRTKSNPLLTQQILENSHHSGLSSRAPIPEISESADMLEDDAIIQTREVDDSLDQVIMAIDVRDKGTVGCCYYVAKEEKLYLMDDVNYGGIEVIDARRLGSISLLLFTKTKENIVKLHVLPSTILLSTRIDETVETYLDHEDCSREYGHGDGV